MVLLEEILMVGVKMLGSGKSGLGWLRISGRGEERC
jgi:hypothetical protein